MLGNGRLEAQCFDGARRLAHIRGKLRKKVWINQGDIILLSLRDYQDEKGDVIMKYSGKSNEKKTLLCGCAGVFLLLTLDTADEARSLKAYGELPENAKINETDTYGDQGDEGIGFEFDEDRDDSDDDADGTGKKEIDIDDI
jgi:translation initiation factor 1A